MGLFDFLKRGNSGNRDEKTLQSHAERVLDKRSNGIERSDSIDYLIRLGTEEAWRALLPRFNFNVDSPINDRTEKRNIFNAITARPDTAITPIKEYMQTAESLIWPINMLKAMMSTEDLVTELLALVDTFSPEYERRIDRKQDVLTSLSELKDPRIGAKVSPFLKDFHEDIRVLAARVLLFQDDQTLAEPLVKLLTTDESMRLRSTLVEGLAERGWNTPSDQREMLLNILSRMPNGRWTLNASMQIVRFGG